MSKGPLVPADETLNHQIVDTFATVSQTDLAWTEKIWCTAMARDGSLQIGFGLGKYTNRGVLDGHGGVARGRQQWTVRGSRRLAPDAHVTSVGPIRYEVVEPLVSVRCVLEATDVAPIGFDVVLTGDIPPGLESGEPERSPNGYRVSNDVLRYHQTSTASGWVAADGARYEVTPDTWVGFRDHSWGVRQGIGQAPTALAPGAFPIQMFVLYSPMRLERPDGSTYGLFVFDYRTRFMDGRVVHHFQAAEELPDGQRLPFHGMAPELQFDDATRHLKGGVLRFQTADGTERPVAIQPVADTAFYLGPAGYLGYGGANHGDWQGELVVNGEHLPDTGSVEVLRQIHQIRDLLIKVDDPVGGGTGYANLETVLIGAFPEMGVTAETTYI
jgi:hypothetical protein